MIVTPNIKYKDNADYGDLIFKLVYICGAFKFESELAIELIYHNISIQVF